MRRVLVVLLAFGLTSAGAAEPGAGSGPGPLPGEIVTRIGQVAAIPADERLVPGYAGAWRMAAAQRQVLDSIKAHEARAARPCQDVRVTDSVQAAPDLLETRPRPVHHALEHWTVQACGAARQYEVWYRFEKDNSRVLVADSAGADFQAELDPPYRRLRELAAARRQELAAGGVRWLNLPLPADSLPSVPTAIARQSVEAGAPTSPPSATASATGPSWSRCRACRAAKRPGPGPRCCSRGMQGRAGHPLRHSRRTRSKAYCRWGPTAHRARPCKDPARLPPRARHQLSPNWPVVKAIEGPDWLYRGAAQLAPAGPGD
jgi:hypothetical protein